MKVVDLGQLVKIQKGKKLHEVFEESADSMRYIQIDDLRNNENIKYALTDSKSTKCIKSDILIAWDGANAGTVGFGLEGAIGSTLAKLSPIKEFYTPYVGRLLQSKFNFLRGSCTGATIPHISKSALLKIQIPVISISEQKRIAAILDKADALRQKNKQLLAAYDELLQATFLDMFGDPVTNPNGWEIQSLTNFGEFKNGLNYSKGEDGVEIRCLSVGDFKDKSILTNVDSITKINLSATPKDDYFLNDGDLIFVRSNGNRELVGRCLVIYPGTERISYSGFCIRFRIKDSSLNAIYLSHLFRAPSFKSALLQNGRGANIQNINQNILDNLKTPIPPKKMQESFCEIVKNIEAQKALLRQSIQKSEDLFNGLVQKAFKGEL